MVDKNAPLWIDSVHGKVGTRTDKIPNPDGTVRIGWIPLGMKPIKQWLENVDPKSIHTLDETEVADSYSWEVLVEYMGKESKFKTIIGEDIGNMMRMWRQEKTTRDRQLEAAETTRKIADQRIDEEIEKRAQQGRKISRRSRFDMMRGEEEY
jgi:hypothetical protein